MFRMNAIKFCQFVFDKYPEAFDSVDMVSVSVNKLFVMIDAYMFIPLEH